MREREEGAPLGLAGAGGLAGFPLLAGGVGGGLGWRGGGGRDPAYDQACAGRAFRDRGIGVANDGQVDREHAGHHRGGRAGHEYPGPGLAVPGTGRRGDGGGHGFVPVGVASPVIGE